MYKAISLLALVAMTQAVELDTQIETESKVETMTETETKVEAMAETETKVEDKTEVAATTET